MHSGERSLQKIYDSISKEYGPQNWWPTTPKGKTSPEYSGGPKNESQRVEVCVGAILTQNTSWHNVEMALVELNKKKLMDARKLANIEHDELATAIRSSGYHNQKAKKLRIFFTFIVGKYGGKVSNLFKHDPENMRAELLSINGIGPETADSIILYAANKPIFVVDAYTQRIFQRLGFQKETYDEFQELFMKELPKNVELYSEYHALIVEHGKNICQKKPLCKECCLNATCPSAKSRMSS